MPDGERERYRWRCGKRGPENASETLTTSGRQLEGLRVLVTRDRRASDEFASHIERLGAIPLVCPAIEIRFRNPPGLDEALLGLDRFDWLVLTSANAVRAIEERFQDLPLDPGVVLGQTRIAVVGETTRSELENLGGAAEIVASSGTAAGLASDLVKTGVFERLVLFPSSRIVRPELPSRLREAGADVVQLAVYETVAPAEMPLPDPAALDVATFASPSAVQNVLGVVGAEWVRAVPVICIGETTADAARDAGAVDVTLAAEPSMAGIAAALLEFRQRRQQEV